ncbi:MAG: CDP-diacylglycerol--serine O-phosphatidyltransferase [Bacteroidota bacterium]|nr:CDP-diacylglycerol--serine O-phosphatidyltransferase [Bacteroidota bacterium]
MKQIPNFITCLNLAAGFIASILAANGNLTAASWFIVAAMIFDFCDGFSARLLKAYSETGKELDSLADVISFGVAPAMIVYRLINNSVAEESLPSFISYIPVIMPVCAALRLAIFNTDPSQASSFRGLPTPANAIAVISIVIASEYSQLPVLGSFIRSPWALIVYTLLLSVLMVTRIPLLSLKIKNLKFRGNEGRFILGGLIVISFIFLGFASTLLIIPYYIIVSLVEKAYTT